jgi:inner membrane protein
LTTLITHPLPVLAIGLALGSRVIAPRLLIAGMLAACLPDADVLAFKFGIAYADSFGHRGASHSLAFAALMGVLGLLFAPLLNSGRIKAGIWLALAAASHSVLDALTNGGLGVAWLWPWSEQRFFLPWRPIAVSPFINGFFSERGLAVLASEARWVWLPCTILAVAGITIRKAIKP